MRKPYGKTRMNIMKMDFLILGFAMMLLTHIPESTVAFNLPVKSHSVNAGAGKMPRLKYYRLELSACKNCPDFLKAEVASTATLSNEEFEQVKAALRKSVKRYNLKLQANPEF